jgi:uncharacterized integral membrane protein (TIGR00698 family)
MLNRQHLPGLLLTLAMAAIATWLARFSAFQQWGLSALTLAIVGGILIGNTVYSRLDRACAGGVALSKQKLLRLGIILFGFRLTFHDVAAVGAAGILADILVLSSTFTLAYWLGTRYFGMDKESAILIGAGSSICGAAAVLATEPVVRGGPEKVAVAVATVMLFGTASMFLYPVIYHLSPAIPEHFGIYIGSTVHEVAQVVVAAHASATQAEGAAVITKMIRVMMLAPFLLGLSVWKTGKGTLADGGRRQITIPWFALGFIAVAGAHSYFSLPAPWAGYINTLDNLMLAMAMAALVLGTHLGAIRKAGMKPLALAGILFVYLIAGGALINCGVERLCA